MEEIARDALASVGTDYRRIAIAGPGGRYDNGDSTKRSNYRYVHRGIVRPHTHGEGEVIRAPWSVALAWWAGFCTAGGLLCFLG